MQSCRQLASRETGATTLPLPENDIKEELSYAYIHTLAARAGFSCDRPAKDRQSMDVIVHSEGPVCQDFQFHQAQLGLQLKATACAPPTTGQISFALPINNYNDLRRLQVIPRLLVVFLMPLESDQWVDHQIEEHLLSRRCAYYLNLCGAPPVDNETNRTVHVPRGNVLTVESLTELMAQASRGELQHAQ
jgi:hypothetical protein